MVESLLNPVREDPARSTILSIADEVPFDWGQGVVLVNQPAGHARISMLPGIDAPGALTTKTALCGGTSFYPFSADWTTELTGLAAVSAEARGTAAMLAEHSLEADAAFAVSVAIQKGVTGPYGNSPGFATLTTGTGAGQVPYITTNGVEASKTGNGLSLERAVYELLNWWRTNGLPGMCVIHLPAALAPFAAARRLLEPGQQGPVLLAGGAAWVSFGPGYDPTYGPAGTASGSGNAWIWVSSRVYAAVSAGQSQSVVAEQLNASAYRAEKRAIYAFNTSTVAAALVAIP